METRKLAIGGIAVVVAAALVRLAWGHLGQPRVALYWQRGMDLYRQGNLSGAEEQFTYALALKRNYAPAYRSLAILYGTTGRLSEALVVINRLEQMSGAEQHLLCLKAQVLLDLGSEQQATEAAEAELSRDPNCFDALKIASNLLRKAGYRTKAKEYALRAIQLVPEDVESRMGLADLLYNQGQFQEAITFLKQVIELQPNLASAHCLLGSCYARLRTKEQRALAEAAFLRAIELDPTFGPARYELGRLYAEEERHGAALAQFAKAIELMPATPDGYYGLWRALKKLGREEQAAEAKKKFDYVMRLSEEAKVLTAKLFEDEGNFHLALRLAQVKATLGLKQEAHIFLEWARRLRPDSLEVRELTEKLR